MIVERFVLTPFQQNTRIVVCEATGEAACVDPGEASEELVDFLRERDFKLKAITLTHGHLDHVGGTLALAQAFPNAEVILHKDDENLYYGLPEQPLRMGIPSVHLAAMGMEYETPPRLTRNWVDGENFAVGELKFEIRHCPGHTRGHIVMVEHARRAVFVGDCLFAGSIGRTDLPGGDYETLLESIRSQLLSLDDDYTVYSGHGPETTIGHERHTNPFLTGVYQMTRGRFI
ncbi:MAG: MBL fold metallo-hydrolase [Pyrinomonadaceae bacterium]|nr:MBL fold metallo-hydrolase [Pyrinomonadaceae bacterium]